MMFEVLLFVYIIVGIVLTLPCMMIISNLDEDFSAMIDNESKSLNYDTFLNLLIVILFASSGPFVGIYIYLKYKAGRSIDEIV